MITRKRIEKGWVAVLCCYCCKAQTVPEPPCLVKCDGCGREYRVFLNLSRIDRIAITKEAEKFFDRKTKENV